MSKPVSTTRAVVLPYVVTRGIVLVAAVGARQILLDFKISENALSRNVLLQWDGAWYKLIATSGYDYGPLKESLRFFPLYPMLARALAWLPGISESLALLLIANACALAVGWIVYAIVMQERDDPALAQKAVWLIYLAPPAFVLAMGYAESLYLLLSGAMLLLLRRQRWWIAAPLGFLAALTRPVGVLLALPAVVEGWRRRDAKALAPAIAPALGLVAYLAWVERKTGSFLTPMRLQNDTDLRGGWVDPFSAVAHNVRELFSGTHFSAGIHLVAVLVFAALLYVAFKRWPLSFSLYAAASLFVALGSRNLDSFERYGYATIVLVLAGADVMTTPEREHVVYLVAAGGLAVAAMLAFTGVLVP
jgi:hypothetical protein